MRKRFIKYIPSGCKFYTRMQKQLIEHFFNIFWLKADKSYNGEMTMKSDSIIPDASTMSCHYRTSAAKQPTKLVYISILPQTIYFMCTCVSQHQEEPSINQLNEITQQCASFWRHEIFSKKIILPTKTIARFQFLWHQRTAKYTQIEPRANM